MGADQISDSKTTTTAATAGGWARLRAQLEGDGALSAADKALVITMVAASRGRDELLGRELDRLAQLGGAASVAPAASVLTLARGREVADRFAAAAGLELDWSAPEPAPAEDGEVERARQFFAAPDGSTPPPIALLARHAPVQLLGYRDLRCGVYEEGSLEPRLVEMALFAISAADYLPGHAAVHATKAVERGAGEAELVEAGLCAVPAAGMAAWLIAAGVIDELGLEEGGEDA